MDKKTAEIIKKYLTLIKGKYKNIETAYLFGSFAKGKQNKDSDIDLALIFSEFDNINRFDMQVQLMLLASQIDLRIEPHPISHKDFYSGKTFSREIHQTGIELSSIAL